MCVYLKTILYISFVVSSNAYGEVNNDDSVVTNFCSEDNPVVLGCTNIDPPIKFSVTYPITGEMECKDILSIDQAGEEPTVSISTGDDVVTTSTLIEDTFYTLLLVDTTPNSPMHPLLHYGASNIPSISIMDTELVLSTAKPFSSYRGPAPPSFLQTQLYNYEWIVAQQDTLVPSAPLTLESNLNFDYVSYLESVNATVLSTKYFSSGNCVSGATAKSVSSFVAVGTALLMAFTTIM